VLAAYYRTWYGNFMVTQNQNQTPRDFNPYCVTAPTDPLLPGGGGAQVCGLYDVRFGVFGVSTQPNLVTRGKNFGEQTEVYDGVDLAMTARAAKATITGGVNTGRTVWDNCYAATRPDLTTSLSGVVLATNLQTQYCRQELPFRGQTQIKISGSYSLPLDFVASVVLQNLAGPPLTASRAFANAEIASSLGRNLSACAAPTGTCTATTSISLIEPNTIFEDRVNQLDVRLTKVVRFGRARFQGMFDLYNVFNADSILAVNGTYGSSWRRPTTILGGRLFKIGGQFDF
jgi:hypothetical protein